MNNVKLSALKVFVLMLVILIPAATSWAYKLQFTNKTDYEITVDVFEIQFIGVFNSLGPATLSPGEGHAFFSTGAFCFYDIKGTVKKPLGNPGDGNYMVVPFYYLLNPEGFQCQNTAYVLIEESPGVFKVTK